jgi:tetratricopeptide (TPR) repeat protein
MAQKKSRSKASVKSKRAGRGSGELERYEKALESMERGLKSLYKGDVDKAKTLFEELLNQTEENELRDRLKSYLNVCEQKLAPQRRAKNAEELVTQGILALNTGDSKEAIKLLTKALESEPKSAHVNYCLAAAYARSGDAASTADHLKKAIEADPTSRIHAKADADFTALRDAGPVAALLG